MRYDIRLAIDYSYPGASDHVRNLLRLLPSDGPGQRVLARELGISPPPDERRDGVDFFGNTVTHVAWHRPVARIGYVLRARIERLPPWPDATGPAPDSNAAATRAAIAETKTGTSGGVAGDIHVRDGIGHGGLGPASPLHFTAPSPRIAASGAITAFARKVVPARAGAARAVQALGEALHAEMTFDPAATDVSTPPDVSFAARRGVCQDFAQIMIAGLRGIGVPAGYVSGFLRTTAPPGKPRLQGVDAMHGWISAWCGGDLGWQDYDPTNRCWVGADHVTVARGRDYGCAAPVHGAIRTAGDQTTRHVVDVIAL